MEMRQNAIQVLTIMFAPSNSVALNGTLALRRAEVDFKYACSQQDITEYWSRRGKEMVIGFYRS